MERQARSRPRRLRLWAALILAGCASGGGVEPPAPPQPRPLEVGAVPQDAPSVLDRLELLAPERRPLGEGYEVEFRLQSLAAEPLSLAYAIDWFDDDGTPLVSGEPAWTALELPAGGSVLLRATAPQPGAGSWKLRAVAYPWPPVDGG